MFVAALFASLASAQSADLTLSIDGALAAGEEVTFGISGAVAGERVYLLAGNGGTSCPSQIAPHCLDIDAPRVYQVLFADAQGYAEVTVTLPSFIEGKTLQAATRTAISASEVAMEVVIQPGVPQLTFSGMLVACSGDSGDVLVEYIGEADEMVATAYLNGQPVVSHGLDLLPGAPGAVFLWAEAAGIDAPTCDQLTWVYEGHNASGEACAVQGDEATDLLATLPAHCVHW